MTSLRPAGAEHADAVLVFETVNRAWFAASVSDRGDGFFTHFAEQYAALLADQEAGLVACYLLLAEDGAVLGRFNLRLLGDGVAELGYRVAEAAAGRGTATAAVTALADLARTRHGVRLLRAATPHGNLASQRVLAKAGFSPTGPAGPADLGGKQGTWHEREL